MKSHGGISLSRKMMEINKANRATILLELSYLLQQHKTHLLLCSYMSWSSR